jgi:hypothetical protein
MSAARPGVLLGSLVVVGKATPNIGASIGRGISPLRRDQTGPRLGDRNVISVDISLIPDSSTTRRDVDFRGFTREPPSRAGARLRAGSCSSDRREQASAGWSEVGERSASLWLGGAKRPAMLAILLLHRGEVVSSERLIDELWGERPPASGTSACLGASIAQDDHLTAPKWRPHFATRRSPVDSEVTTTRNARRRRRRRKIPACQAVANREVMPILRVQRRIGDDRAW